jgi:DNA helicase-2/ATP-dependent DNA helicase PcrA
VSTSRSASRRRHLSSSPFTEQVQPDVESFDVGDRVTHDKHGLGRVVSESHAAVVVDFGTARVSVQRPFTRLTKL